MKNICEWACSSNRPSRSPPNSTSRCPGSCRVEVEFDSSKSSRNSLWSSFFGYTSSVFEAYCEASTSKRSIPKRASNGWTTSVKKVVIGIPMRRIHEKVLGVSRSGTALSTSDIWFLGLCYKMSRGDTGNFANDDDLTAFELDFSSRIWITYRKGFERIGDSKWTSDVGWGCMLRSSQMLVAQALMFHRLGRCWRKNSNELLDQYIDLLHLFGDSRSSSFSIHNIIEAGGAYNLAPGSWVGPYSMCRTWETLVYSTKKEDKQLLPMSFYVVSGDENGERGGAPVICRADICKRCYEFSGGHIHQSPIVLLVPLVLGLDKINRRYIPLLKATFAFPQSLGILGGKSGSSTYIVGVQDDNAIYLDPHEVQPVVEIRNNDLEADTSSYHCSTVRHILLDSIDPSLAIGFYCRDQDDLFDFCDRASKLAEQSDGAPLFTVANNEVLVPRGRYDVSNAAAVSEDDWQLL